MNQPSDLGFSLTQFEPKVSIVEAKVSKDGPATRGKFNIFRAGSSVRPRHGEGHERRPSLSPTLVPSLPLDGESEGGTVVSDGNESSTREDVSLEDPVSVRIKAAAHLEALQELNAHVLLAVNRLEDQHKLQGCLKHCQALALQSDEPNPQSVASQQSGEEFILSANASLRSRKGQSSPLGRPAQDVSGSLDMSPSPSTTFALGGAVSPLHRTSRCSEWRHRISTLEMSELIRTSAEASPLGEHVLMSDVRRLVATTAGSSKRSFASFRHNSFASFRFIRGEKGGPGSNSPSHPISPPDASVGNIELDDDRPCTLSDVLATIGHLGAGIQRRRQRCEQMRDAIARLQTKRDDLRAQFESTRTADWLPLGPQRPPGVGVATQIAHLHKEVVWDPSRGQRAPKSTDTHTANDLSVADAVSANQSQTVPAGNNLSAKVIPATAAGQLPTSSRQLSQMLDELLVELRGHIHPLDREGCLKGVQQLLSMGSTRVMGTDML